MLENIRVRNVCVNDVHELRAFLHARGDELSSSATDVLLTQLLQAAPTDVQRVDARVVAEWLEQVDGVLDALVGNTKVNQLLRIRDAPTCVFDSTHTRVLARVSFLSSSKYILDTLKCT